jgi:hypothetical protein
VCPGFHVCLSRWGHQKGSFTTTVNDPSRMGATGLEPVAPSEQPFLRLVNSGAALPKALLNSSYFCRASPLGKNSASPYLSLPKSAILR